MSDPTKPVFVIPAPVINDPRGAVEAMCCELENLTAVYRLLDEAIFNDWVAGDQHGKATIVHSALLTANLALDRVALILREANLTAFEGVAS